MTRTKTCILDAYRGLASVRSFHLRAASAPLASLTVSKYFIMIDVNLYEIQRTDARPRAEWSKWSRSVSEGEMREATRDRLMQLHILLSRLTLHRLCLIFITFVIQFICVFL